MVRLRPLPLRFTPSRRSLVARYSTFAHTKLGGLDLSKATSLDKSRPIRGTFFGMKMPYTSRAPASDADNAGVDGGLRGARARL